MNKDVIRAVKGKLNNIQLKRHQLVFLVTNNFKNDLRFISEALEIPYVNVNFELSRMLKDLPQQRRSRKVNELLKKIIKDKNAATLVLDNIEVLFDKQLQQNPVLLLEDISRNYTLVVNWRGRYNNRKLVYGEPEHVEYFTYDYTEGIILENKQGGNNHEI